LQKKRGKVGGASVGEPVKVKDNKKKGTAVRKKKSRWGAMQTDHDTERRIKGGNNKITGGQGEWKFY